MDARTRTIIRLWKAGRKTGADVLAALGKSPSRALLLEVAGAMGVAIPESATVADIEEIIAGA